MEEKKIIKRAYYRHNSGRCRRYICLEILFRQTGTSEQVGGEQSEQVAGLKTKFLWLIKSRGDSSPWAEPL